MFFGSNIKLLRKRRGRTQDDVARKLKMKRPTLSGYENNIAQPGLESLVALSDYFNISLDTLIRIDLAKISESQLSEIERGYDVYVKGSKLRVLTSTVDKDNIDNIELVPEKAKAGYSTGFADPDYIKHLPVFHLPFLSKEKKYRSFQISGDSMHPIPDGAWITGEFLIDWTDVKNNQAYIILTNDEGIVFKIAENNLKEKSTLTLHSLNPAYEPYDIEVKQIREIWRFVNFISPDLPEPKVAQDDLLAAISHLRSDLEKVKSKID